MPSLLSAISTQPLLPPKISTEPMESMIPSDTPQPVPPASSGQAAPSCAESFIRNSIIRKLPVHLRPEKKLDSETEAKIISDVVIGITSWDYSKSKELSQEGGELKNDHIIMALFMDALYKHHFKGTLVKEALNPGRMLSDADLNALFHQILNQLQHRASDIEGYSYVKQMRHAIFEPRLKETFEILQNGFNEVPHLRSFAAQHRWRLLVDPIKIDQLEKHGIDCNNPLLAFIFDGYPSDDKSYANRLAKAWVATMSAVDEPLTVQKTMEIIGACNETIDPNGLQFGAYCSHDGMMRIADFMHSLKHAHSIKSEFRIKRNEWYMQDDTQLATKFERHPTSTEKKILKSAATVRELLESENHDKKKRQLFLFRRYGIPGKDDAQRKNYLQSVLSSVLEQAENISTLPPDEVFSVIAKTYLDGEFLHAMSNGNYRLWGLLIPNLLLAKAGQRLSLIKNPFVSDGSSQDEVVEMLKEGQDKCDLWRIPEPRAIAQKLVNFQ